MKLAYVVDEGWEHDTTGVSTFIKLVRDEWQKNYDCEVIERYVLPRKSSAAETPRSMADDKHGNHSVPVCRSSLTADRTEQESMLRLLLGYLAEFRRDIGFVWRNRRRLKARVIVTNEFGCETLPVALRVIRPREKIVAIAHTHPGTDAKANHPLRRFIERMCYASASDIVFNSDSNREAWREKLDKAEMKGVVIRHGIPVPDTSMPDDYPTKPVGTVDFVCVAQFYKWKGQLNLLRIWKQMLKFTSSAPPHSGLSTVACAKADTPRLIFVGGGQYLNEAKEYAHDNGLDESVIFLDARSNGARYFNGADVAVLLPTEPEAFGLVLLEAMSRSKPVFASRLGGIREIVRHGQTGYLVDPLDSDEVGAAIAELAMQPAKRVEMGQRGYEKWNTQFTAHRMLRDYDAYFAGHN